MVYLQITMKINEVNRQKAAGVYSQYKDKFLKTVSGALSKELLVRDEDVQVLHGFKTTEDAQNYLNSSLFTDDVVTDLSPLMEAHPDVRIYQVA